MHKACASVSAFWLAFGNLNNGTGNAGLSNLNGNNSLGNANWNIAARHSDLLFYALCIPACWAKSIAKPPG